MSVLEWEMAWPPEHRDVLVDRFRRGLPSAMDRRPRPWPELLAVWEAFTVLTFRRVRRVSGGSESTDRHRLVVEPEATLDDFRVVIDEFGPPRGETEGRRTWWRWLLALYGRWCRLVAGDDDECESTGSAAETAGAAGG